MSKSASLLPREQFKVFEDVLAEGFFAQQFQYQFIPTNPLAAYVLAHPFGIF